MNAVLSAILETGETTLADGRRVKVDSHIDSASGAVLQRAIASVRPSTACEVGLAYGVSTLYMLEALANCGGTLIGMDPAQNDAHWQGGGLANVSAAGFSERYRFYEEPSQVALPRLAADGVRVQLGFIDGWHTFDHTLVDFFFIDRMLDDGGIIVFDDLGYPAIRRVCDFVLTNRAYELVERVEQPTPSTAVRLRRSLKKVGVEMFGALTRTDKSPGAATTTIESAIGNAYFAAFRKRRSDDRRFDHFVPF